MSLAEAFADDPVGASPLAVAFSDTPIVPARQALPLPQALSWSDKLLAKVPSSLVNNPVMTALRGFSMGAADPSVGATQLVSHLDPTGIISGAIDRGIHAKEQQYEQDRGSNPGFDFPRLAGNVLSPANLVFAQSAPTSGASLLSKTATGAKIGAMTAASQPLTNASESQSFWLPKGMQAGAGAIGGGVAAPIASKLGDAINFGISKLPSELGGAIPGLDAKIAAAQAPKIVSGALQSLKESGVNVESISPAQLSDLNSQVVKALQNGKQIDPTAILRDQDFKALGILGTSGQLTRDPTQFAAEQNLRNVSGVGAPLMERFGQQDKQLQTLISSLRGNPAEPQQAGSALATGLAQNDNAMSKNVSAAYNAARNAAGKDLDIPLQGLAQDYAQVLNDFGDKVPSGVRNQFNALGLDPANPSNQKRLFTPETADKLNKVINANWSNDPAVNNALGRLNQAVKNSVTSIDASGGPFAPAVALAKERFQMQDAIPALKAAANGSVNPDDFVNKFVVNGKTDQVKAMAALLRKTDPVLYQEAKAQIGDTISRSAFGGNPAGDSPFTPSRYADQLRKLGTEKLSAFYTPEEIKQIQTIGRVGAYIKSAPSSSPVNYSNSGSAATNVMAEILKHIPGAKQASVLGNAAKTALDNNAIVERGIGGMPAPSTALTPEQAAMYARVLQLGGAGAGATAGGAFR